MYEKIIEKTMDYLTNTSIASPDGEYNLTMLTIWLQKIPHIDIKLNKINSTFNPEDNDYLESLGILVAIPGFWLILTLLFFLIFFLCRCCDVNSSSSSSSASSSLTGTVTTTSSTKKSSSSSSSSCQLTCCKCILFLFTLITIMIISINFYGTYQSQQGLSKVQKSLNIINDDYLKPFDNLTNEIDINLDQKIDLKLKLLSQKLIGPLVRNYTVLNRLTDLVERLRRNVTKSISKMSEIKTQLHIINVNQLPEYLQIFEYYRLPITLGILCSLLFICLLLLCGICRHSRCLLIIFSVLGLLCLVICWVFTSLYLGITVSGTDFCLKPKPFLRKQFSSNNAGETNTIIIDYYLNCDQYEYDDGYNYDYYDNNNNNNFFDQNPNRERDRDRDGRQRNRDEYTYDQDSRRKHNNRNNERGTSASGSKVRGSIARNDRTNNERRGNYEIITGTSTDNQDENINGLKHPFQSHYKEVAEPLINLNEGLEKISRLCENYCHDDELKMFLKELKERINYVMSSLNKIRKLYDCQDVHNEYVNIMDYTCKDVLEGVTIMLITSSIIGILLTLLVLCASHTWINIRKKRVINNEQNEETDPFLPPVSATSTVSSANSKRLRDNYVPSSVNRPSAPAHRFSHTPPQTPHFPATGPMNQSLPTPPSINGRSLINCREEQFSFLNAPPSYEQVGHHHSHHGPSPMMQQQQQQVQQQQAVGPHYVVSYRKT